MRGTILKVAGVLCFLACGVAQAAGFSETKTVSGDTLTVTNLIGEIRVTGHNGSGFEVVVDVQGDDASRENVRIETGRDSLTVVFPKSKKFVYPALTADEISFRPNDEGSWIGALLGGSKIEVSRRGNGLEIGRAHV